MEGGIILLVGGILLVISFAPLKNIFTSTYAIADNCGVYTTLSQCIQWDNCKWVGSIHIGHCEVDPNYVGTTTTVPATTSTVPTTTTVPATTSTVPTTTTVVPSSSTTTTTSISSGSETMFVLSEVCASSFSFNCPTISGYNRCEIHRMSGFGDCVSDMDSLVKTCSPGDVCSTWDGYALYQGQAFVIPNEPGVLDLTSFTDVVMQNIWSWVQNTLGWIG